MSNSGKTVTGYMELKNDSIIDAHNHVYIKRIKNIDYKNSIVQNNIKKITKGLSNFVKVGGSAIIDCQPYGCGRDCNVLKKLSRLTGIGIIAATGFHRKEYYSKDSMVWKMNGKKAEDFFESEILYKLYEEENKNKCAKAGIIKIAYIGKLEGQYMILTDAAVRAAIRTNTPILVHTERGLNIRALVDYLEKKEFPPDRAMLCHMDKLHDLDLHTSLIERGFYLEYDTFLKDKYKPEENAWSILKNMINIGYCDRITIGSDATQGFTLEDEYGLGCFFSYVIRRLELLNIDKDIINKILFENVRNFIGC